MVLVKEVHERKARGEAYRNQMLSMMGLMNCFRLTAMRATGKASHGSTTVFIRKALHLVPEGARNRSRREVNEQVAHL